jgi:DNA polymerase-4
MSPRSILHVDMDAFYAAVEVLDNPALAGKPVIVGGTPEGRGVVSTASYEARRFGVHSAMPAAEAVRRCPQGIFLAPRFGRYAAVSAQVFAILEATAPLVEPISIDEAFLDVTGCGGMPPEIARGIQERVESETGGLTCSIGCAENKFLAKVASDLRKPRGLVVVPPGGGKEFLAPLDVERLWGAGPKTSARLREARMTKIGDVAARAVEDLVALLGPALGEHLAALARGLDDRPVAAGGEAKSVSQETTFAVFLSPGDAEAIERVLFGLADGVAARLRGEGFWGRTVTLKVRDGRFRTCLRSVTLAEPTQVVEDIYRAAADLFRERVRLGREKVRLLGVGVKNLERAPVRQLDLFDAGQAERDRAARLAAVSDAILRKHGDGAVTRGRLVARPGKAGRRPHR